MRERLLEVKHIMRELLTVFCYLFTLFVTDINGKPQGSPFNFDNDKRQVFHHFSKENIECLHSRDTKGTEYEGTTSQTEFNKSCIPWNTPGLPQYFADQDKWSHNFCRNDGKEKAPFCFIMEEFYQLCNISSCVEGELKIFLLC